MANIPFQTESGKRTLSDQLPPGKSTSNRYRPEYLDIKFPGRDFDTIYKELVQRIGLDPYEIREQGERAAARWACISAKSHRDKKNGLIPYSINIYEGLTEINPIYEQAAGSEPPSREGETIFKFSTRSRQRLLRKMRTLKKKNLNLPYFVTLTYRENMQDHEKARADLQRFFNRLREQCAAMYEGEARKNEFKYVWKKEYQERGAIHFHAALYFPDLFIKKWVDKSAKKANKRLKKLREKIGRDWAECVATKEKRRAVITYRSKKSGRVTPSGRRWKKVKVADQWHQKYGTNVREVLNSKMAFGYMAKYIGKVQEIRPGSKRWIDRKQIKKFTGESEKINEKTGEITKSRRRKNGVRCYYINRINGKREKEIQNYNKREKTGRFWGFSYNLDFEALHYFATDESELEAINEAAKKMNEEFFLNYLDHQAGNANRAAEKFKSDPARFKAELEKINFQVDKQARRYQVNKEKIKRGYSVQFEILSEKSLPIILSETKAIPAAEYFAARIAVNDVDVNRKKRRRFKKAEKNNVFDYRTRGPNKNN